MVNNKLKNLDSILKSISPAVIAFSGGVDSSFLVYRASKIKDMKTMAVTLKTLYTPSIDINGAIDFCKKYGIEHHILDIEFPEIIRNNPPGRCYLCKKHLFGHLIEFAIQNNYRYVADGSNADDLKSDRPGLKANSELSVISPLAEAGLTKDDIRKAAKKEGLPVWNKPAMTCLLTRLPYNTTIKEKEIKMIEEAENFLFEKGFFGTRVRMHGDIARLECLPGFMNKFVNEPERIDVVKKLKEIGFRYVSLDLEGYRPGSMDLN